ncbi:hypothetical protein [Bradyrhizobium sp. CCBAU 11361]|uniref:hypothetical protein n=1 Tax=Bradyrhizobium sp. CCBAU 11361 TaxID=1630812 RepID=UPI0023022C40|nr:hypothetical protein [Bradyrhizobium sp. CCBAU 11361]
MFAFLSNKFLALSLTRNLILDLQPQSTVYLVLESAIQGRQTMRRLALNTWLVIVLAASSFSARADENKPDGGSSASLAPRARIECSLKRKPGEPLDPPSTAAIPGSESFVASEHFREDIAPTATVKISWLGATFARRFAVKVEAADATSLQTHVLNKSSSAVQILGELGPRAESKLADIWCLLKQQANGESGALQTSSVPNLFFVRDGTGDLGVVDALWGGAGWEIGASPVGSQRPWTPGTRVFSH